LEEKINLTNSTPEPTSPKEDEAPTDENESNSNGSVRRPPVAGGVGMFGFDPMKVQLRKTDQGPPSRHSDKKDNSPKTGSLPPLPTPGESTQDEENPDDTTEDGKKKGKDKKGKDKKGKDKKGKDKKKDDETVDEGNETEETDEKKKEKKKLLNLGIKIKKDKKDKLKKRNTMDDNLGN